MLQELCSVAERKVIGVTGAGSADPPSMRAELAVPIESIPAADSSGTPDVAETSPGDGPSAAEAVHAFALEQSELPTAADAAQQTGGILPSLKADVGARVVLVKLQQWHLFDFSTQAFRYMDPWTDPLAKEHWRTDMVYGYGFSYVYTREAWHAQAFPDAEDCEDDIFMSGLRK